MSAKLGFTEQLMYSTVRIEVVISDNGISVGSGFIYRANSVRLENGQVQHMPVIVTNRHVVEGAKLTKFYLHVTDDGVQPILSQYEEIGLEGEDIWFFHPTLDLAFCGLHAILEAMKCKGRTPFYRGIDVTAIPTAQEWGEIMPAEEILMVGYPDGQWDYKNNLPFVRRGIVSSLPSADFQGRNEFVIDAACFCGSSGSPVFLANLGRRLTSDGVDIGSVSIKLLGILWGGLVTVTDGEIKTVSIPTCTKQVAEFSLSLHLGLCIKSSCLTDIDTMVEKIVRENEKMEPK